MNKIDIYVNSPNKKCRLASIKHEFVDGSVYLTLVRENQVTSGYFASFYPDQGQVGLLVRYMGKGYNSLEMQIPILYP